MFEKLKNYLSKSNLQKEELNAKIQDLVNGFEYFGLGSKMAQDIITKKSLTIHQEKLKCKQAYEDNAYMQTGVNKLTNIILGVNPEIWSENKILKAYAKKWYAFSGFKQASRKAIKQAIISGDGYVRKIKGSKGSFKYCNLENAEDIYIEWNYKENRPNRFIERLYYTEAEARKLGLKTFTLKMPWGTETINGIEYNADEIIHFQFMESRWGIYGRSPISSALNDIAIMDKMERALAVIAMFKAIPQKLLMPKTTKEDEIMDTAQINNVIKVLKNARDFESPVIGKEMTALNMTDGGQMIDLSVYLDYFKRKISIVLSPEFIVHGELVNRSTSTEQKQLFYLDITSLRNEFTDEMDEAIDEGLLSSIKVLEDKGVSVPKATFEFIWGEFEVELVEQKRERLLKEWNSNLIKRNEYREELDYPSTEEDDFYRDEVTTTQGQIINNLKNLIKDEKLSQNTNTK